MIDDKQGFAIAGFVIGLLNLCAWLIPICGGPFAIFGIILSAIGMSSPSQRGLAITGFLLSIFCLLASIANGLFGLFIMMESTI